MTHLQKIDVMSKLKKARIMWHRSRCRKHYSRYIGTLSQMNCGVRLAFEIKGPELARTVHAFNHHLGRLQTLGEAKLLTPLEIPK